LGLHTLVLEQLWRAAKDVLRRILVEQEAGSAKEPGEDLLELVRLVEMLPNGYKLKEDLSRLALTLTHPHTSREVESKVRWMVRRAPRCIVADIAGLLGVPASTLGQAAADDEGLRDFGGISGSSSPSKGKSRAARDATLLLHYWTKGLTSVLFDCLLAASIEIPTPRSAFSGTHTMGPPSSSPTSISSLAPSIETPASTIAPVRTMDPLSASRPPVPHFDTTFTSSPISSLTVSHSLPDTPAAAGPEV
jgi:hypothetical protein